MMKIFLIFFLVLMVSTSALAAEKCDACSSLNKIYDQYKAEAQKDKPGFNSLQLKASKIILKMGQSKKDLSPEQVAVIVKIYAIAFSVDPGRFILDNTVDVLTAHRTQIEDEVKKLPVPTSEELLVAIAIAITSNQPSDESSP